MHARAIGMGKALTIFVLSVTVLVACERRDDHSMTPLMYAAQRGDTIEIKRLLERFADTEPAVKPHNRFRVLLAFMAWMQDLPHRNPGWTALMFAIDSAQYDAARVLLDHGANPSVDANGMTALDLALLKHNMPMTRLLIERGAKPNPKRVVEPMIFAAARNDTALISLLLDHGANVNAMNEGGLTPLMAAAQAGAAPAVALLLARGADKNILGRNNWRAARFALAKGHEDIAETLGAGNDKQNAELFAAIDAGNVEKTFGLIRQGADINALDDGGRSALIHAVEHFSEKDIFRFMDAGARIVPGEAGAIMYLSVWFGHERVFDLAQQAGAQPRDNYITDAVRNRQVGMVKKLLALGLDPNAQNVMQRNAFELARLKGDKEILAILENGPIKERRR